MDAPAARILIADDEPDIIAFYRKKFEKAGFQVFTATNGAEALVIAASEQPDLIIMDVKMPEMNGIAAQKKLHEAPLTKNIKVVF